MKTIYCPYCNNQLDKLNLTHTDQYECLNHNVVVRFIINKNGVIEYTDISIEKIKLSNIMYIENEGYVEDEEYYQYMLSIDNKFNLGALIRYDQINIISHLIAENIPSKNWIPENFENKVKTYLTFQ